MPFKLVQVPVEESWQSFKHARAGVRRCGGAILEGGRDEVAAAPGDLAPLLGGRPQTGEQSHPCRRLQNKNSFHASRCPAILPAETALHPLMWCSGGCHSHRSSLVECYFPYTGMIHPFCIARVGLRIRVTSNHTVRIPGWRASRASLCPDGFRPSNISIGSGRTLKLPVADCVTWPYRALKSYMRMSSVSKSQQTGLVPNQRT